MCGLARMRNEKHKTKYALTTTTKYREETIFENIKWEREDKKTLKYSRFVTSTHRINTFEPSSSSSRSPKMYMYYVLHGSRPVLARRSRMRRHLHVGSDCAAKMCVRKCVRVSAFVAISQFQSDFATLTKYSTSEDNRIARTTP